MTKAQIGFGTAAIGRPHYINLKNSTTDQSFDLKKSKKAGKDLLEKAYQKGIRYFDTAPGYGVAEDIILEWLAEKNHTDIEIATKWGYTYTANFDINASQHEVKEHSLEKLNEQWAKSKSLLPHLSTYQIHSATFESGVLDNKAVLHQLHELKEQFGLRIGLSASGTQQTEIVKKGIEIEIEGSPLFSVFQVTYNILEQGLQRILNSAISEERRFVIKEAMANGRLLSNPSFPNYQALYKTLNTVALKHETTSDAVALRFCMDSIKPFIVLSGVKEKEQLTSNLNALAFKLDHDDLASLKQFKTEKAHYWSERSNLAWQ